MDAKKLLCRAFREKPETIRASRKAVGVDFSKLSRMGFNENVFGMSPKALEALKCAADQSFYYPDFMAKDLKNAIAEYFDVPFSSVLTASGSSAIIDMLGAAFLEDKDEVLFCMPTFGAFLDMAYVNGATPVIIPLKEDLSYNLEGILAGITDKTKMIVVCNPNNPTGTYVGEQALLSFLSKVPDHIVVVMDEAYIEFAKAEDCVSMLDAMKARPEQPIVIMRTFSKFYGMAGVRVGYALAQPEIIAEVGKCSSAWNLSRMAQAAAIEALHDEAHGDYVRENNDICRSYLMEEMKKLGCVVYDSQSNFIYFDAHKDPTDIYLECINKGILIGAFELNRVSVGTMEQCREFIGCLGEIMAQ